MLYTPYSFPHTYPSGWKNWPSILDFFGWSCVYLGLRVHFCSFKWTQGLCLIFDVFIHPNYHVNHTASEMIRPNWPVLTTELTTQRTAKKSSARGQILFTISLVIFHRSINDIENALNRAYEMESMTWVQILGEAVRVSFCPSWKGKIVILGVCSLLLFMTLTNSLVLTTESTNQRTAKKGQPRVKPCRSYYWLFSMTVLLTKYQLTFEFIYFEFYTCFTKLKWRPVHYVTWGPYARKTFLRHVCAKMKGAKPFGIK